MPGPRLPATWRRGLAAAVLALLAWAAVPAGAVGPPHRPGVRTVSVPARAPLAMLARPGLRVRLVVMSGTRSVRLRLLRRASGRAVAAWVVPTRGRRQFVVRWRPRTRLAAGSYLVEARAQRAPGRVVGAARRARLVLTATAAAPGAPGAPGAPRPTAPGVGGGVGAGAGGLVVAAAGDIACAGVCGQAATAQLVTQIRPQAVLGLGDFQYQTGTLANLAAYYNPYWGQFKNITWPINGGEHDFYGTGDYLTYFNAGGPVALAPEASYSFDLGSWHVVALNSYCFERPSCDQATWTAWLRQDLAAHPARCTLAYYHEPYWTSPSHHGPDAQLRPWIQALYDAGVDVVLQGHNHLYERFAPQDPDSRRDDARGIVAFTVGTGGASHYPIDGPPAANSVARDATTWGVLRLVLGAGGYDFQFVPVPGQAFTDAGSGSCH